MWYRNSVTTSGRRGTVSHFPLCAPSFQDLYQEPVNLHFPMCLSELTVKFTLLLEMSTLEQSILSEKFQLYQKNFKKDQTGGNNRTICLNADKYIQCISNHAQFNSKRIVKDYLVTHCISTDTHLTGTRSLKSAKDTFIATTTKERERKREKLKGWCTRNWKRK